MLKNVFFLPRSSKKVFLLYQGAQNMFHGRFFLNRTTDWNQANLPSLCCFQFGNLTNNTKVLLPRPWLSFTPESPLLCSLTSDPGVNLSAAWRPPAHGYEFSTDIFHRLFLTAMSCHRYKCVLCLWLPEASCELEPRLGSGRNRFYPHWLAIQTNLLKGSSQSTNSSHGNALQLLSLRLMTRSVVTQSMANTVDLFEQSTRFQLNPWSNSTPFCANI